MSRNVTSFFYFFAFYYKNVEKIKTPVAMRQGLNICTGWELHMLVYFVLNLVGLADCILNELADYVRVVVEIE